MAGGSVGGSAAGPRLYADPHPRPDESAFQVDNTSAAYYNSPYFLLHQSQIQPVPAPRVTPPRLDLGSILPAETVGRIAAAKRIVFHAVGDTGAAKVDQTQTMARALANEASVADTMTADLSLADPPEFFFHLGDVIYNFGEGQYYYDQFYEPFRGYDRPIFAIPGNHDGMVFGPGTDVPQIPTLTAFLRNFCASSAGPSPDGGGLVRSTMTQPGVYFTLDAPAVSIIGLYSNVLDGPGVLSSENGAYPLGDEQIQFLTEELSRLRPAREAGERAVILAVHHPPASVDAKHGGTLGMSQDIDRAVAAAGLWPDAVLSGHAHLYQRFTRATAGRQIPYVVAGSGGFAATAPMGGLPPAPLTVGEFTLVAKPVIEFGYLTVAVDWSVKPPTLSIAFRSTSGTPAHDRVTVDLSQAKILPG